MFSLGWGYACLAKACGRRNCPGSARCALLQRAELRLPCGWAALIRVLFVRVDLPVQRRACGRGERSMAAGISFAGARGGPAAGSPGGTAGQTATLPYAPTVGRGRVQDEHIAVKQPDIIANLAGKGVPAVLMVDNSPAADVLLGLLRMALKRPGWRDCHPQRGGSRGLPLRDRQGSFAAGLGWFY